MVSLHADHVLDCSEELDCFWHSNVLWYLDGNAGNDAIVILSWALTKIDSMNNIVVKRNFITFL